MIQKLKGYQTTMVEHKGNLVGFKVVEPSKQLNYLVLTLDHTQLPIKDSLRLAQYANAEGTKVVFVPDVSNDQFKQPFLNVDAQRYILGIVAYHSTEDIKTAVLAGSGEWESTVEYNWSAVAYSYNQVVDGKVYHAESVLAEFLTMCDLTPTWWLMLLEPCWHCLRNMLDHGAEVIVYIDEHKAKWNTPPYLHLKRDLKFHRIKTNASKGTVPVLYVQEVFI